MKNKKWQELGSEIIAETPWVKILKKDFCRPDGTVVEGYYLMEKPVSVYIAAITGDGKIVLIKHYRPGLNEIAIELPAGSIKGDETSNNAASRELLEETGYKARKLLEISNFSQDTSRFIGCACRLFIAWDLQRAKSPPYTPSANCPRDLSLVHSHANYLPWTLPRSRQWVATN